LLLTTVKWASTSGKPFLGEDRAHSGLAPSVEVKRPENGDSADVEDLSGNDDETKPNQPNVKPGTPSQPVAPKPQPEDTQLKKALELLRDKPAASAQRAA
jgi:hypothetical protein